MHCPFCWEDPASSVLSPNVISPEPRMFAFLIESPRGSAERFTFCPHLNGQSSEPELPVPSNSPLPPFLLWTVVCSLVFPSPQVPQTLSQSPPPSLAFLHRPSPQGTLPRSCPKPLSMNRLEFLAALVPAACSGFCRERSLVC